MLRPGAAACAQTGSRRPEIVPKPPQLSARSRFFQGESGMAMEQEALTDRKP